jgi:hypothetical protein
MVGMNVFVGSWITRLYTVAVCASAIGALAAPGSAGVLLIALTSPVSIIFAPIYLLGDGWLTTPMLITSVLAGYLLNIAIINLITRPGWSRRVPPSAEVVPGRGVAFHRAG